MAKIEWDKTGEKLYETGVKNGVLYLPDESGAYANGVAWNGLTSVKESPSGAEATPLYADDIKYLELTSAEEFGGTLECYTYPDEFAECDGSAEVAPGVIIGQQNRKTFGLCYRTTLGNDVKGNEYGYKLHLIYGAKASPSEKAYSTINDSPEAITFSYEITTTPVNVTGYKPTASLIVDSTKVGAEKMAALEAILYGGDTTSANAKLPLPDEVINLLKNNSQ
nr:MAG TPA: tail tube protein [Caudoviricetes sp.]